MTPVGGVMVTVALFTVAMTTVFGADDVCLLECRTERRRGESRVEGGQDTRVRGWEWRLGKEGGAGLNKEQGGVERGREREGKNQKSTPHLIQSRWPSEGLNWMLHVACNEIQH